jgi:hypothetical protein
MSYLGGPKRKEDEDERTSHTHARTCRQGCSGSRLGGDPAVEWQDFRAGAGPATSYTAVVAVQRRYFNLQRRYFNLQLSSRPMSDDIDQLTLDIIRLAFRLPDPGLVPSHRQDIISAAVDLRDELELPPLEDYQLVPESTTPLPPSLTRDWLDWNDLAPTS